MDLTTNLAWLSEIDDLSPRLSELQRFGCWLVSRPAESRDRTGAGGADRTAAKRPHCATGRGCGSRPLPTVEAVIFARSAGINLHALTGTPFSSAAKTQGCLDGIFAWVVKAMAHGEDLGAPAGWAGSTGFSLGGHRLTCGPVTSGGDQLRGSSRPTRRFCLEQS